MRIFLLILGLAAGYFLGFKDGRAADPSRLGKFVAGLSPDSMARVQQVKASTADAEQRARQALDPNNP